MKNKYLSVAATFALVACSGGSSGSGGGSSATSGYQGLGSKWTIAFTGASFRLNFDKNADGNFDSADDMIVEGTYTQLDNGFKKMVAVSAEGDNAPTAGAEAIGLEIPGFSFFLKPLEAGSEPIVMVQSGTCPTADVNMNWIIAKYQDPDSPKVSTDGFGTAEFKIGENKAHIDPYHFDDGTNMNDANDISLLGCNAGTVTFDDGVGGGTMYATANGGMLVNPGNGIIFAAPQLSADPVAEDLNGTYSGLLFTSGDTEPAKVTLSGGAGTGSVILNVENDTTAGDTPITALTPVTGLKGIIRGEIDGRTLNCVYSSVSGKNLLACNGKDGDADVNGVFPMFFFLGVKR